MDISRTAWGSALFGVLACAGCDQAPPMALPRCTDGQGLATDAAGNFQCTALHRAALSIKPLVPGCGPGQALTYGADLHHLTCVDKLLLADPALNGAALRDHILTLEQKLVGLTATVAQLQTMIPNKQSFYVGSTSVATTGRITSGGTSGILAAQALCTAEFGDKAHMCTQFQLTRTLAVGKLGAKDRIAPAWIYMPTWHNPGASTTEPLSGLADNCGGYTTGDDTAGWTGMAVEWSPLDSGDVVFHWHGGAEAPCSQSLPFGLMGTHPSVKVS